MLLKRSLGLGMILLLSLSCKKEQKPAENGVVHYWKDYVPFEAKYNAEALRESVLYAQNPIALDTILWIKECSGMSASRLNPGYAWVHNDSGNDPFLYLMRLRDGKFVWTVYASNWTNTDWEDLEVVKKKDGGAYIYVGEFGDNQQLRQDISLYRIDEPRYTDSLFGDTSSIGEASQVRLVYPDKPHDVEGLLADQSRGDVYLVTKRDNRSMLFGLPFRETLPAQDTLVYCGSFPFNYVTAASSNLRGNQVAIRTYQSLMLWTILGGVDFRDQLSQVPEALPYGNQEIQGESIALTDSGYYLLSEATFGIKPVLYFYRKL